MRLAIPNKIRPLRVLLVIALLEIFLGGGGRLIDTGSLSIRMYLFIITLFFGAMMVVKRGSLHRPVVILSLAFSCLLVLGAILGIIHGQPLIFILVDLRPLLFFYYILFFAALIRTEEDVELIKRLLKASGLILAVGYLGILALIRLGMIPFQPFYLWANHTEEFFFRGDFAFFYKGFIFLCAGIYFYKWSGGFWSKIAILTIIAAVFLTFTRGFVLSFFLLYLFKLALVEKKWIQLAFVLTLSFFLAAGVWAVVTNSRLGDSRSESDAARIEQLIELKSPGSVLDVLLGRGFGMLYLPNRETQHLEITYIEIFFKQGIIGLAFWAYLAYLIFKYYNTAAKNGRSSRAKPFLLASMFAYIQSFTNPYINNPMGMTLLIVSLISLYILSRPDESTQPSQK